MSRIHKATMTAMLAVALAALVPPLQAQVFPGAGPGAGPGPGMMGMGMMGPGMGGAQGNPVMILLAPSVQKELKLSEDQKAKIYTFVQKANQKGRDLMQTRMFGGNANPQAMMEASRQLRQQNDKEIAGILDKKQKQRYDEIVLQNEGPLAVARPEIAAKLRMNETQQEYVQGVMMEMRREFMMTMRQSAASGQFNPNQMREFSAQLRKEAVKEISKVIDRKQQKTFNSMLGAPFDLAKLESEAASAEAAVAPAPPAGSSKPADTAQTKDTQTKDTQAKDTQAAGTGTGADTEKAAAKPSDTDTTTKKDSSGSGPNP